MDDTANRRENYDLPKLFQSNSEVLFLILIPVRVIPVAHDRQEGLPVYHVQQELLEPESELKKELQSLIEKVLEDHSFPFDWQYHPQEPNMLFGMSMKERLPEVCVVVRNSGTEDKLSLYLRGLSKNKALFLLRPRK